MNHTYRCYLQDGCNNKSKCVTLGMCAPLTPEPHLVTVCCGNVRNCASPLHPCVHRKNAWNSRHLQSDEFVIDPRTQPANPKQAYGDKKIPLYLLPFSFAANVCVALYEGLTKYGLVNWRVAQVEAMTYVSACKRHLDKWTNGEECDPATKVRHLANAGACIAILIDAQVCGTLVDNRPWPIKQDNLDRMIEELEATVEHLKELHADRNPKHYHLKDVV